MDKICEDYHFTGACGTRNCKRTHEETVGSVVLLPGFYHPKPSDKDKEATLKKNIRSIHRCGKLNDGPRIEAIEYCISPKHYLVGSVYIKYKRAYNIQEAVNQLNATLPGATGYDVLVRTTPINDLSKSMCSKPTNKEGVCNLGANCTRLHFKKFDRNFIESLYAREQEYDSEDETETEKKAKHEK